MSTQPTPSQKLSMFAQSNGYGRPFTVDDYVWTRYLESSFNSCGRHWNRLNGKRNQAGNEFAFELGLIENKNLPNAICAYDTGTHFILVYHTFPMFLLEFFNRLLASSIVLSDIGDAQGEIGGAQKGFHSPPGFGIMAGEAQIHHMDDIVETFGPRCPERRSIALELFQYAMQFVLEHEMAHAVNGHVHFAQKELGLRGISESAFRAVGQAPVHDRQYSFLEGSADKGSYFSVITGPILQRMHTPFQVLSSGDQALVSEVKLKILAGSFLAVFWMISDVLDNKGDIKAYELWSDHPSSLARALGFAAMPLAQGKTMPAEIQFFVEKGTRLAWEELIKLSATWGLFRPFGWLTRKNMYSQIFESYDLPEPERHAVIARLDQYRYRP